MADYIFDLNEPYYYTREIRTALSKTLYRDIQIPTETREQVEQDIALMFDLAVKAKVIENLQAFNSAMDNYESIVDQTIPDASLRAKAVKDKRNTLLKTINPEKPINNEDQYDPDFDFLLDYNI